MCYACGPKMNRLCFVHIYCHETQQQYSPIPTHRILQVSVKQITDGLHMGQRLCFLLFCLFCFVLILFSFIQLGHIASAAVTSTHKSLLLSVFSLKNTGSLNP